MAASSSLEVRGKVESVHDFGVYVDVGGGAYREAIWPARRLPKPSCEYKVGDEITGLRIVELDPVTDCFELA